MGADVDERVTPIDIDDAEHVAFRAEAERLYALWLLVHVDLTEPEVIDVNEPEGAQR